MRDEGGAPAARLERLVRSNAAFMAWLEAARDCCPPDWAIGAGAIRNLVWDHLTGRDNPPADIDVAYVGAAGEEEVERCLRARLPGVPWQAKDQALVHTWYERVFGYPVEPLASVAEAVATWPETCTSVAVRLRPDGGLDVIAPCGLDDLFGLVLRRNPRRVTVQRFRQRLVEKRIPERWPDVKIIDP
jgi:hypothetical protein